MTPYPAYDCARLGFPTAHLTYTSHVARRTIPRQTKMASTGRRKALSCPKPLLHSWCADPPPTASPLPSLYLTFSCNRLFHPCRTQHVAQPQPRAVLLATPRRWASATLDPPPNDSFRPPSDRCGPLTFHAVLGRFVYALNLFCKDRYGMDYSVGDYWIYEFAKVGLGGGLRRGGW